MSLGMGVMINYLCNDGSTAKAVQSAIGRTINMVGIEHVGNDQLVIRFTDESELILRDMGQSCCESRYMTFDGDDMPYYSGATFLGAELADVSDGEGSTEDSPHDIQFLNIKTSKGVFTVSNHNEHNGYYSGFSISAEFKEQA